MVSVGTLSRDTVPLRLGLMTIAAGHFAKMILLKKIIYHFKQLNFNTVPAVPVLQGFFYSTVYRPLVKE
jgi:hypothetical protein